MVEKLTLLPKPSLDAFIKTCTPLAIIPELEEEMRLRVEDIATRLASYDVQGDEIENLASFLQTDRDFLGIALSLTNLSQEKFLRILSAERFISHDFEPEWTTSFINKKLKKERDFAIHVARLLSEGKQGKLLSQQVATFYLDQLVLPSDWHQQLRDSERMRYIIRHKLSGEYANKKGKHIEARIRQSLDRVQEKYGVTHSKRQVRLVGKEVDHRVPAIEEPYVMIMTSYLETTSSGQTARANEQDKMYSRIQEDNRRYNSDRAFVNFVDGGGWLARRSDLRKLHAGCDYIINLKTLDQLEAVICKHVPAKYFVKQPPPTVEG
jgi:hypothetical protein